MKKYARPANLIMACIVCLIGLCAALIPPARPSQAQTAQGVVRAVLFYSPTCSHCNQVMTHDLPPLLEKYGDRLQILAISVANPDGYTFFQATIHQFAIPDEQVGVPMLIIDETVLTGSTEIPQQLPALIEHYLAQGGTDWPPIPGLAQKLAATQSPLAPTVTVSVTPETASTISPTPASSLTATPMPGNTSFTPTSTPVLIAPLSSNSSISFEEPSLSIGQKLARDPLGNGLAVIVLLGLLFVVVYSSASRLRGRVHPAPAGLLVLLLAVIGLGVAGYLAYVESAQVTAICGPVGDCNTVQQSTYARLFGLLPIGVLGVFGYILILLAWAAERFSQGRRAELARNALYGLTFCGALFSIYLTFLEPFVIGATCAWCLSSAVIMATLLWLTSKPARAPNSTSISETK
jgi:uncharacterized membrane protein